jgi:germination protein M
VFYVDNQPLTDANGVEVGMMTNDSFVDNPGEKINSIQEADIVLYFASQTGDGLVKETQHVYYSSNISTEKLVMERLLEGPESENARASIPSGTGLISVSVMDGVCFVNLDENFLVQNYEIREDVIIYSIVDSLTELSTVDTVQISVNGETNLVYRDKMSLTDYYRRNLELVTEDGENVEINQQEEKEGFLDSGQ